MKARILHLLVRVTKKHILVVGSNGYDLIQHTSTLKLSVNM